jgi:hypothetical protein
LSQLKKVFFKLALVKSGANAAAVSDLMKKYKSINTEKSLKKGYKEMALINLSLAEMCFDADNEVLRQYEEKLTECE